jgi:Tol biopolymer transport system component
VKTHYRTFVITSLIGLLLILGIFPTPGSSSKPGSQKGDEIQRTCLLQRGRGGIAPHYEPFTEFMWSSDGTKILFASYLCGVCDIYVIDADGHNLTRLTKNWRAGGPAWSPDGTKIAFNAVKNGSLGICIMDQDGKNKKRLTQHPDGDIMFNWSPDGEKIIFLRAENKISQFYSMDTDGNSQEQLINLSMWAICHDPVLSPDGRKILLSSEREGNEDIYIIEIGETTPRRLTEDPHRDFHPVWSPDGTLLIFGREVSIGKSEIYVMNADGSNPQKVFDNAPWNVHLSWSPDGKTIAFDSEKDGNHEIYVISIDGSNLRRLTADPASDQRPVWSPDGEKILFRSESEGITSLCVMNKDGSSKITLANLCGDGPLWFCFVTSQLVYWLFVVITISSIIVIAFFQFKSRDHRDKRVEIGVTVGALCGTALSILMLGALSLESSVYSPPFWWVLLISFVLPGVLVAHLGRKAIYCTDDLIASVMAAAAVFSLFFVFTTISFDIHSGTFGVMNSFLLFVLFFFIVFLFSVGSGSLYAQYILRNPIPKKKPLDQSST